MSKITTNKIKNSDPKITSGESVQQKIDIVAHFIEKNSKYLAFGFLGLLVGCGLYFSISYYSEGKALKTFDAAFAIEKKIDDFTINEKPKSTVDLGKEIKETKTPESDPAVFAQINSEVIEFIKSQPAHSASRNLAIKWASYLYSEDKFENAFEILNLVKAQSNSLDGLNQLTKAASAVQMGKLSEAIDLYKGIVAKPKFKYLHPEARFQMSLAMIENKNELEAIENLKIIKTEYPDQKKTVEEANKIMRWLQYQKTSNQEKTN